MPSWLGRQVIQTTGPAAGSAGAEIQARYMAVISAGERRDAAGQIAAMDEMVAAAEAAGFWEVVAAVDRYRFAVAARSEPLETAVKATTRAIYSLPFRPASGSRESALLNAWANFDMAPRHPEAVDFSAVLKALVDAAVAADARNVVASIRMLMNAPNPAGTETALRALALSVYKDSYHRPPPPPLESY